MADKYVGLEQYKRSIDSIKNYIDKSIPCTTTEAVFTLPSDKVLEIYNSDTKTMEFDKPSVLNLDSDFVVNYNNKDINTNIMTDAGIKYILCNDDDNNISIAFVLGVGANENKDENKMVVVIETLNTNITITDVVLKRKKIKYLNNKYLKSDVIIRNSLTIGSRKEGHDIGLFSFSNGDYNIASGWCSHAEGYKTEASGDYSHAEGSLTIASGRQSHAEGRNAKALQQYSHAEGQDTTASGTESHAEGYHTTASGNYSHAEGCSTIASGTESHAEGYNTTASGESSHAEGNETIAKGQNQHVQGKYNIEDTANAYAHIVGNGSSTSERSNAHTLDWSGNAWYSGKLSQDGIPTEDKDLTTKKYVDDTRVAYVKSETECVSIDTSTMKDSFVDNSYTYQQDAVSYLEEGIEYHVEVNGVRYRCLCINNIPGKDIVYETIYVQGDGFSLTINNKLGYSNNKYSEDITKSTVVIELSDTLLQNPPIIKVIKMDIQYMPTYLMPKDLGILNSLGINRIGKIGTGSVSLGYNNVANNDFSTALGVSTSATAIGTLAHGGYCEASANYSHAEGYKTESSGMYSHAEGIMTLANGQGAHAEGFYTVASGQRSHAEGSYTLASSQYQHVEGKFNVEDKANKYAHIVGNGTSKTARKNAYTLDWSGNAWYQGSVYTGGTSQDDTNAKKLATEEYVNNSISSIVVPTKTSDLTNDSGFITSIPGEYITEEELTAKNYIDNTTLESKGYLTEHQDISGLALKSELHTHTNKAILDAITSDKINSWDSKSTFSGSYNDLADKPTIPTKTSQLTNDSGYLTEHQSLVGLATETYVNGKVSDLVNSSPATLDTLKELADALGNDPNFATTVSNQIGNKVDKVSGKGLSTNDLTSTLKANYDAAYTHSKSAHAPSNAQKNSDITKAEIEAKLTGNITSHTHSQYLTEHQSLNGYAKTADLATVATSGSYNDLTNKPTIPTVTNDLTNVLKSNYDKAYTHSQVAHAPSNAQKNSDITKSEIEAKLTGNITTHTHSQYLTSIPSEYITEQELTNKGYITEAVLTSKGYATATTNEEVKTTVNQILGGAYIE